MKNIILVFSLCFYGYCYSQDNPGLGGLAVKIPYDQYEKEDRQRAQQNLNNQRYNAEQCIMQTKSIYNNAPKYPEYISDGEHKVMIIDGNTFCGNRIVYVESGKIKKYYNGNNQLLDISFSGAISNAKTIIKTIYPNGRESNYIDIYFIEDIYK